MVGPHFEQLCRDYTVAADPPVFGEPPEEVAAGSTGDPSRREQIEIDVVAFARQEPGRPRRVIGLGEAKWGEVMGTQEVERLRRARESLAARGFDTAGAKLACFGAAGFDDRLRAATSADDLVLVPLDDLYAS